VLDFQWKEKAATPSTEIDLVRSTVHPMGFGIYRGYQSTILDVAQMDSHGHIVLHEMDRSNSNEAGY
jgi:hypothetical protein